MTQSNSSGVFTIKPLLIDRQLSGQRLSECCSNEEEDDSSITNDQQDVVNIGMMGGRAATRRATMLGPEMSETARLGKKKHQQSLMVE